MRSILATCLILLAFFLFIQVLPVSAARQGLADVNRSGVVNGTDTSFAGGYYGTAGPTGLAALADTNQDGAVDILDISFIGATQAYVVSSCELEDINNSGSVTQADLTIVSGYLGQSDNSTNMIADLNGDGSISASDVSRVQACIPTPTATPTPTSAPSNTTSEPSPNPNDHPFWEHTVMAGPNFVGLPTFITSEKADVFIDKSTHHDDLSISFAQPLLEELPKLPWSQGLNIVSEIVKIEAVSAFNGYAVNQTDNPFIVVLPYYPERLHGLSATLLSISHYDVGKKSWVPIKNPMVIDYVKKTIATTTDMFGFFAVTYPSNVW